MAVGCGKFPGGGNILPGGSASCYRREKGGDMGKPREKSAKRRILLKRMKESRGIYLMMLPVVAFFLIFSYYPMYGIIISFKDFFSSKGIVGSPWLEPFYKNFEWLFAQEYFFRALKNTLIISLLKLVFCFPVPIILALFLAEIPFKRGKKWLQVALYLPYFFSWAVIATIVYTLLATNNGLINNIITALGGDNVEFMTNAKYFYLILLLAENWKNAGWGTVAYVAAITNVNPELYEVAKIDGCSRLRMMRSITVPCILPIIVIMFIMQVGNILNVGFDPIFNLYNPAIYSVSDILDTYVYRLGITGGEFEKAAALGLFKSVFNVLFLVAGNFVVKKITGQGIYE